MLDKTTIIISHRISSVKLAKKILVMDEGKLLKRKSSGSLKKREASIIRYKNQIEEEKIN